jgi:type IV secretory pathway TrbL component
MTARAALALNVAAPDAAAPDLAALDLAAADAAVPDVVALVVLARLVVGRLVVGRIVVDRTVTNWPARDLAACAVAAPAPGSVISSTWSRTGAAAGAIVDGRDRTSMLSPAAQACSASAASTGPRTSGTEIENVNPPGPLTPIGVPALTFARPGRVAVTWR